MSIEKREKGPVEILCKEIGFQFDARLERTDLFVSFVAVLVSEISRMRCVQKQISGVTGVSPSAESSEALRLAAEMLNGGDRIKLIAGADAVHAFTRTAAPEDAYPCDHLIDMVSSCASAIRFGMENPCRSRHAASAAQHIWKHVYGVILFDSFTPNWEKDWARAKFQEAILLLVPALTQPPRSQS